MSLLLLHYTTATAAAAATCNYERPICTQGVKCYKTTCKTNNRCNCIYNIPPIIPSHVLGLSLRFLICHSCTKLTFYLYSKWVIFVARHPFSCISFEEDPPHPLPHSHVGSLQKSRRYSQEACVLLNYWQNRPCCCKSLWQCCVASLPPPSACFAIAQPLYYALHEQEGNSAGKREREVERKGSVKEDKGEKGVRKDLLNIQFKHLHGRVKSNPRLALACTVERNSK